MKQLIVLALLALLAARAGADPRGWRGGASLHYDASYVHRLDDDGGSQGLGLAGATARAFVSKGVVGYLVGLDLRAGSTNPGGFAYQVDLYLIGAGVRLGRSGLAGVGAALGASGAVGTLDDGAQFPIEAFTELPLGARLRLLARARATWLPATPGREDGSPTLSFADELDATLALRWGRRYRDFGFPSGNGYFAGVAYREALDARFVGAVIGYSIDVGSR